MSPSFKSDLEKVITDMYINEGTSIHILEDIHEQLFMSFLFFGFKNS